MENFEVPGASSLQIFQLDQELYAPQFSEVNSEVWRQRILHYVLFIVRKNVVLLDPQLHTNLRCFICTTGLDRLGVADILPKTNSKRELVILKECLG